MNKREYAGNRILIYAPGDKPDWSDGVVEEMAARGCVWCGAADEVAARVGAGAVDALVICLAADGAGLAMLERMVGAVPILVAAPPEALETRIAGLKLGALDYLIRPFDAHELLARVATALHRGSAPRARPAMRLGGLCLDLQGGRLGDGERWTALTPSEHQALALLFEEVNRPVSKERLKSALADGRRMTDNAIEVVIHRLRAKARAWNMRIRTLRGAGYVLEQA